MSHSIPESVPFFKMQGTGNDFVFIDNRSLGLPVEPMPHWARRICRRAFGVGADGLVFLEPAPQGAGADYIWHFYNADGSRAEMCGNASRCAARLAVEIGLAGPEHVLGTDAGPIRARVLDPQGLVKVQLTEPRDMKMDIRLDVPEEIAVHFVNTGVPHAVLLVDDAKAADVKRLGPAIRFHKAFASAGTNANFVQVTSGKSMNLRTYERGVEDETLACGTGAAASLAVTHALGLTGPEAAVTTTGGEVLTISLENGSLFLQGMATRVYTGNMDTQALGL